MTVAAWSPLEIPASNAQPSRSASVEKLRRLEKLPEGLDGWADKAQGWFKRRPSEAAFLWTDAQRCAQLCAQFAELDTEALQHAKVMAQENLRRDPMLARGQLIEALALVGQVAFREMGMQPYPVQFMGALSLHHGWLAEMATGEGKTLTVALAAVLAGWSDRPCHVITANDYLAERDAETMRRLFDACGVSLASVNADVAAEKRPALYNSDVVYVTPKELLADYLRDQLAAGAGQDADWQAFQRWMGRGEVRAESSLLLVRGLHTAIVDEADSVLIDEAVTPLILSARRPSRGLSEAVVMLAQLAPTLVADEDYDCITRTRSVRLRDGALAALERLAPELPPVWRPAPRREELLRQALQVHCFFRVGHQYLVDEGEVVLLDEFTGRMTPGRTLTAGLHQAVEAKEGLEITDPNEALSQMSFQAFFRGFSRLSGSSGTVWEAVDELWQVYRLRVVRVPTHRPRQTIHLPARVVLSMDDKWRAVAQEVIEAQKQRRAVLVGVRSVESSEILASLLLAQNIEVAVLNAVHHAEEAAIVAVAGEPGRITIATNMAGRGTDIRLDKAVEQNGGLHVVIAEVNESARIDRQLAGRCGRQGDPGSVSLYLCLEDTLVLRYLPSWARRALTVLRARLPNLAPVWTQRAFVWAQRRSEGDAFERRFSVLRNDDWMASALPFAQRGSA
jgi:preprotein translocase subunit SecA